MTDLTRDKVEALVREAVEVERERCAEVASSRLADMTKASFSDCMAHGAIIAAGIRERDQSKWEN